MHDAAASAKGPVLLWILNPRFALSTQTPTQDGHGKKGGDGKSDYKDSKKGGDDYSGKKGDGKDGKKGGDGDYKKGDGKEKKGDGKGDYGEKKGKKVSRTRPP